MASTVCAFCGRYSHFTIKWAEHWRPSAHSTVAPLIQGAGTCDNCRRSSVAVVEHALAAQTSTLVDNLGHSHDDDIEWFPTKAVAPPIDDVPAHIARAARESHSSLSIGNHMAAILMARTVIEATAKAKGITTGRLVDKIDKLRDQGFVRSSTADAAHEVRHFGNDMAHGDIEDLPDHEDGRDIVALMDEVLNEVFQGPARTARVKARRTGADTSEG